MNKTIQVTPDLYSYILDNSLREPEILKKLRKTTASMPTANMQISPEQGQFMGLLVKLLNAKNILEIGTFTGYSAISIAMNLPSDGKLTCCDINKEWTDIAKQFSTEANVEDKINLKLGPALDTLSALDLNSFDLIFIDADKINYKNYYEKSLNLLKPNGLILFDNMLQNGEVINPDNNKPAVRAIRDLNDFLLKDTRVDISLVPMADGLTFVRKK